MFDQNQPQMQPMGGYNYQGYMGQPQPQQKFNNVLTPEQIKRLQANREEFQISLTEEEVLRATCNHRSIDGMSDALTFDRTTGIARCTICGYEFRPVSDGESLETIQDAVDKVCDYIQTVKIMYYDFPASAAQEYFPILPLLQKLPKLFEYAAKNMSKHEDYRWQYNGANMGAFQALNQLNSMFGNYGYQQPMYQQPMQPQFQAQPGFQQPQFGFGAQPVAPNANPFGYPGATPVQPTQNYNAQYQGFSYVPQPNNTPVAPTVDTTVQQPASETVTETVTV